MTSDRSRDPNLGFLVAEPCVRVVGLLMLSVYPNNHDGRPNNPNYPLPPLWWHQRHSTWIYQERQAALPIASRPPGSNANSGYVKAGSLLSSCLSRPFSKSPSPNSN